MTVKSACARTPSPADILLSVPVFPEKAWRRAGSYIDRGTIDPVDVALNLRFQIPMPRLRKEPRESLVRVPLPWTTLTGNPVSETELLETIGQLSVERTLPVLISLLQYGDLTYPPAYEILDREVRDLFPTATARRIAGELARRSHWMFFSKWQLLLAIKLVCVFGSRDAGTSGTSDTQLLKLLLMINGFYPGGEESPNTPEGDIQAVQKTTLHGYALIQNERPYNLIGRYAELFGHLPAPGNQADFDAWVDIRGVLAEELDLPIDAFKAVLFALYARSGVGASWPGDERPGPRLGSLNPEIYFADTLVPEAELTRALDLVTITSDEMRDQHLAKYGDTLGNPVDLSVLLRKPVIKLHDGSLAGISGQLLVQRYTCGLYWDIHDALPDDGSIMPNRRTFQTFFGELHERYSHGVLRRIADRQAKAGRKLRLMSERDYAVSTGSNPDGLLLETIGSRNTRATLFEFKVGRPRYMDSIVEGDVEAFQEDLSRKIADGLDQEITFCRQLLSGQRAIPDLQVQDIKRWLFVIVVTDQFPSWEILLTPLRRQLADAAGLENSQLIGPFVLSLSELEQLETLPEKRVSELLIDWANGPDRGLPFHTFYAHRTRGQPISNGYVNKSAHDDLSTSQITLLGKLAPPP